VQEGVVFQAAANVAAGARIVNVVHYFFREGHGTHTKESPQRSETPGLG